MLRRSRSRLVAAALCKADGTPYFKADEQGKAMAQLATGNASIKSLGGPGGALGYPLADASTAGRQLFAAGALGEEPQGGLSLLDHRRGSRRNEATPTALSTSRQHRR